MDIMTSYKVKEAISRKGIKKYKVAEDLGISRPTLTIRLKTGNWKPEEITLLKQKGILI